MYKEYVRDFETEIGTIQLVYPNDGPMQVWVNHARIMVPNAWTKQTSQTIIRKVCQLVKTGQRIGVKIGG